MIRIAFFLSAVLFLSACGSSAPDPKPADLAGKKALLKQKQADLLALKNEVAELEREIVQLDPSAAETRRMVTTIPAEVKTFKHYVEIQGLVQSDNLLSVSSETGGRILDLKVIEGQTVTKGQLIARVDLEQLKKQIAEIETSLELAQELYDRQQRLWDQQIGSEVQLLQAKNNVDRLKKSLETLNYQLKKADVYAPIGGLVDRVMIKAGELAGAGMPIVQILETSRLKVVADVPETYLRSVRKGESVNIRFPSLQEERQSRISLVGASINPSNRTFPVEAELSNSGGMFKPNLLAILMLNDYTEPNAVSVPIELVQQEIGGQEYVFVVKENGDGPIAHKVYVKTGRSYDGHILITEGLKGGETLVYEGARGLTDQDLIDIKK